MIVIFLILVVAFSSTFAGVNRDQFCEDGDVRRLHAGKYLLCVSGKWEKQNCVENDCELTRGSQTRRKRDVDPDDLILLTRDVLVQLINGTTTTTTTTTIRPPPPPRKQKPDGSVFPSECGVLRPDEAFGAWKVSNGEEANIDQSPWQVAIMNINGRTLTCGGSVISENYVLTAAHCFLRIEIKDGVPKSVTVREDQRYIFAGGTSLKERAREFNITQVTPHQSYNSTTKANDIALLKISGTFTFSATIQPICIPYPELYHVNRQALITGWGSERASSSTVDKLKRGVVHIISKNECVKKNGEILPITDGMFCAGDINDDDDDENPGRARTDSCQGDSGGPLFANEGGKNYLLGITSWGIGCGLRDHPGVYTKVINYREWIRREISGSKP